MRVLKPQTAKERKNKILSWAVYTYVLTGKPVSSELIASSSGMKISSATIRSVLKELEEAGYLEQLHTSGGRIPTDKGYRAYVDNILEIERQAVIERERVEEAYRERMEELDTLLQNTSRIIANLSKWAGLVFAGDMEEEYVRRLDFVFVSPKNILLILVSHSGLIKHFPISLSQKVGKRQVYSLSEEINKKIKDLSLTEVADVIWKEFVSKQELNLPESEIFKKLYNYFSNIKSEDVEIYLDGLMKMSEHLDDGNVEDFKNIMKIIDDKKRFAAMLRERLKDMMQRQKLLPKENKCRDIEVLIGSESNMKEFGNFSLVSSAYCVNDKAVGLVGVLGHKRMEYPRVIGIVDTVSSVVEDILSAWENTEDDYD